MYKVYQNLLRKKRSNSYQGNGGFEVITREDSVYEDSEPEDEGHDSADEEEFGEVAPRAEIRRQWEYQHGV
jgi:hypothetical protein